MDFRIIKYYIEICKIIRIVPSFEGLNYFYKFYCWEREYNGRCKVD